MALKGDRNILDTEIRYFLNETVSPGKVVVVSNAGSGSALESSANLATVAANSSGNRPLGIVLNEFVNVDQTRFPINWHKDQHQVGDKCTILTKGWVVTDAITGTPEAGQYAVLSSSGTVTGINPGLTTWNQAANPKVGLFRTKKDQAGFASVYVDL